MRPLHILLVEDTPSCALSLNQQLLDLGHKIGITENSTASLERLLGNSKPDLIMLCIDCDASPSKVNVIKKINSNIAIPVIIVTSDITEINHLKLSALPFVSMIIGKSIDTPTLKSLLYFIERQQSIFAPKHYNLEGYILIKDRNIYQNISFDHIRWIQSDGNYIVLQTKTKKYIVKQSLKKIITMLDDSRFIKIQKSYIVRADLIDSIDVKADIAKIGEKEFPIGRSFKDDLLQKYKILK